METNDSVASQMQPTPRCVSAPSSVVHRNTPAASSVPRPVQRQEAAESTVSL